MVPVPGVNWPAKEHWPLLEVIGAGFGRTGTMSLKRALEILGYRRCYHFSEVVRRWHAARWLAVTESGSADWNALFRGYAATVDWPGAAYYRELAACYPDARVILTVRDPDQWHASLRAALLPLRATLPSWLPWTSRLARLTDRLIWQGTFDGRAAERDYAVAKYQLHLQQVRATIDPARLLVYNVNEGWEPLCRFLGKPVPEVPFPRTNSRQFVMTGVWLIRLLKVLPLVLLAALGAAMLAMAAP